MKVSFVLLAHEAPEQLRELIYSLLSAGSNVYLHHDASTKGDMRSASADWGLDLLPGKLYLADQVKVVWGEWSIIEATLNCLKLVQAHDTDSDYLMLLSGSCMPVKPVALLEQYLEESGKDHIEAVNAQKHQWVTAGLQKQRWSKYHFFNWRYQPFLFDASLKIQRKLKINRKIPLKHIPHMGSQWWCLRRSTLMSVLELIDNEKSLCTFYKRTWVPDELFFQTLVANLVPVSEISGELLTRYTFNSWGIPRVYYDDDYPELLGESRYFVRKVSHRAVDLRRKLTAIAPMRVEAFFTLLTQRQAEKEALMGRLQLKQHIEANRWHSLESHQENRYDYIKSIPNQMMVLIGDDSPDKRAALAQLDRLQDTVVYGDLFDPEEVGKGYQHSGYLGLGRDAVKLAKHTWHQVLGDIAYHSPGKTIVFSLGHNFKQYLEVLRWKAGLNVILVDGKAAQDVRNIDFKELYLIGQVLHFLKDRNCELARVSLQSLTSWADHCECNPRGASYIRWKLHKEQERSRWPSLLASGHSEAEFIRQLTQRIVLFMTDDGVNKNRLSTGLKAAFGTELIVNAFNVIPKHSHDTWHHYFADLCFLASGGEGEKPVFLQASSERTDILDALRHKVDLLVMHVKQAGFDLKSGPAIEYTVYGVTGFYQADRSLTVEQASEGSEFGFVEVNETEHDSIIKAVSDMLFIYEADQTNSFVSDPNQIEGSIINL